MLSAYSWGTIRTRTTNLWTISRPTSVVKERTGAKKNTERFLGMSLWIAAKYTQIHHSLNILTVESYFLPRTLLSFGLCSLNRTNTLWENIPLVRSASLALLRNIKVRQSLLSCSLTFIPFGKKPFPWLGQPDYIIL